METNGMKTLRVVSGFFAHLLCLTTEVHLLDNDTLHLRSKCNINLDCPFGEVCVRIKAPVGCQCKRKIALHYHESCAATSNLSDYESSTWTPLIVVFIFGLMFLSCCAIAAVIICYVSRRRRRVICQQRRWLSESSSAPGTSYARQPPPAFNYPTPSPSLPLYPEYDPKRPPPPPYPPPTYNPPTFRHGSQPPPPYYSYQGTSPVSGRISGPGR